MTAALFEDRIAAAGQLAALVQRYRGASTVVLGIPRGGVPVARVVADALGAPLGIAPRTPAPPPTLPPGPARPAAPAPRDLAGRRVILVDDGVATGATARAACRSVRERGAAEIVLAVPVAPPEWTTMLAGEADAFVAVATPHPLWSVGRWYTRFDQVTDAEVEACLAGETH